MIEVLSVENMRESDKAAIMAGTPSRELMWRAALGIYEAMVEVLEKTTKTLIVAGTGNNAGDGYALALILKKNGYPVSILQLKDKCSSDGKYYFDKCVDAGIELKLFDKNTLPRVDIIVDCILGTGFLGEVNDEVGELIEKINASGAYVVSADINSGLNGDSGMGTCSVKSDLTVSIGSYKSGHFLNMAKDKIGKLVNCDIGILPVYQPYYLFQKEDAKKLLGTRPQFSHKGTYGYVTLIGGSYEYSGAVKLANLAASSMRAGAGVVKLACPKSISHAVMPYLLESTLFPLSEENGRIKLDENEIKGAIKCVKAIGVGMGLGTGEDNKKLIRYLMSEARVPLLLDADALNTLAKMGEIPKMKAPLILTPHPKELERLSGKSVEKIQNNPVDSAKEYAKKAGAILLLKGTSTVVTDGEKVVIIDTGCAGMATAGSGDVLSGIITATLAQPNISPFDAVCLGAYINGLSGEIAEGEHTAVSMLASDTALSVDKAIKRILE